MCERFFPCRKQARNRRLTMKTKNFVATLKEMKMIIEKTSRGLLTASMMMFFIIAAAVPAVFAQSGDMPLTASKEALALFRQGLEKAENLEDPGTFFDRAVQKIRIS